MNFKHDIRFTKLHAAGNDFICIDNTTGQYDDIINSPSLSRIIKLLCKRKLSVGADGVVFALRTASEDNCVVLAEYFEPDGSEAEICGNATVCFAYWAYRRGFCPENDVLIQSKAGNARGKVIDLDSGRVMVWLPNSEGIELDVAHGFDNYTWPVDYVHIGLPHSVSYVEDLEHFPVSRWGPVFRHHDIFKPRGVNANFVQVLEEGKIKTRTWEFGVEEETLACGTGACCCAVLSCIRFNWNDDFFCGKRPVEVIAPSGQTIKVWFASNDRQNINGVRFENVVVPVYDGVVRPELLQQI